MNNPDLPFASVVLDLRVEKTYDYLIPKKWRQKLQIGMKVEVPVRGKIQTGFIHSIKNFSEHENLKEIFSVQEDLFLTKDLFQLACWISSYYCTPLSKVIQNIIPKTIRKKGKHKEQLFIKRNKTKEEIKNYTEKIRGKFQAQAEILDLFLKINGGILLTELLEQTSVSTSAVNSLIKKNFLISEKIQIDRSPLEGMDYFPTKPKEFNDEQKKAFETISSSIEKTCFSSHLLFGITGSGKTEVYLQLIQKVLDQKKNVIFLMPEVSLTLHAKEKFQSRFPGKIALIHHRLSDGERFDTWHKIQKEEVPIVIGARSAIFSPIPHLGLIIVDEEHETSYKQTDEMPCYHARDVAVMRAKLANCPIVLGSATPSIESYQNTVKKKYTISTLQKRAFHAEKPVISLVDMKKEFEKAKGFTLFSEKCLKAIEKRLQKGEKCLLFLNRRGYHTSLLCSKCSYIFKCKSCDIPLTFHQKMQVLSCHLCGEKTTSIPKNCLNCSSDSPLKFKGVGTEQVEKTLQAIFPEIRICRMDADTTRHKGSHEKLLRDFATGKKDVLLGTQMIAKGFDFPEVTFVCVLNADQALHIPDFRSSETVFQLITQVAGRSGRGFLKGEVLFQTILPDHPIFRYAMDQDYVSFFTEEIKTREIFAFPPFSRFVKFCFSSKEESLAYENALFFHEKLQKRLPASYLFYPVVPAGHPKIKEWFRYHFLVSTKNFLSCSKAIEELKQEKTIQKNVKFLVDVDPLSTYF